jgi:hypothetical protein
VLEIRATERTDQTRLRPGGRRGFPVDDEGDLGVPGRHPAAPGAVSRSDGLAPFAAGGGAPRTGPGTPEMVGSIRNWLRARGDSNSCVGYLLGPTN